MTSLPADTQFEVRRSHERSFEAGEIVFDEGDGGELLYVIQSGEVELTRGTASGRRLVGRLGPGEFFGEMSVVLGGERRIRATAGTSLRLLEVDGRTLEDMWAAGTFVDETMMVVSTSRIMRVRALMPADWRINCAIQFLPDAKINKKVILELLTRAGLVGGMGDDRKFGGEHAGYFTVKENRS